MITNNGRNVSYNASPGKDLLWSTKCECGVETLAGRNDGEFDLTFFKVLEKELFIFEEYEGLVLN